MTRRAWIVLAALAISSLIAAFALRSSRTVPAPRASGERIVSLAPAITETLFAIGAASRVAGISDFCRYPPEASKLPRLGTSITPNYEAIARIDPTLIVGEKNASSRERELAALAPTELLPWLALPEIVASTRQLGKLTAHEADANALADRLERRLSVPEPPEGPRVLLVLSYEAGRLDEVWFIRRNSLHGAMLRAAGARNAVQEDIAGLPRMSLSRLIELDPEIIVILPPPALGPGQKERMIAEWKALQPLSAARNDRVAVLEAEDALTNGPRVLDLTDRLAELLRTLSAAK